MNRRCIITLGTGEGYIKAVDRLVASLTDVGWCGGVMRWRGTYPPGSPTQEQASHAFKAWCFKAARAAGYESVLWLDSPHVALAPLEPLFEHAERGDGLYVLYCGFWVGNYSSDKALEMFGVSREEALTIRDTASGVLCLDLTKPLPQRFLDEWLRYTTLEGGAAYNGSRTNEAGQVSRDPRVVGHRHDQTVASLILHQLGFRGGVPIGESFADIGKHPRVGKLVTNLGA